MILTRSFSSNDYSLVLLFTILFFFSILQFKKIFVCYYKYKKDFIFLLADQKTEKKDSPKQNLMTLLFYIQIEDNKLVAIIFNFF